MPISIDENRAWAMLLRSPAFPISTLRRALAEVGGIDALVHAPLCSLREWGLPPLTSQALAQPDQDRIEADLRWLGRTGAVLLPCTATEFPPQLAQLPDAPLALYVRGDPSTLTRPQLAIVGSRSPTAAGRRFAHQLARELGGAGFAITSGLARGIDTAAHLGALDANAPTIAVCATGLDQCYPPANAALAERIVVSGATGSSPASRAAPWWSRRLPAAAP
ncbi:MAG: hypothetical protein RL030_4 [Pseudomonadota bacterium]